MSQFLDGTQLLGLCKKPDHLMTLETQIREIRVKYLPLLGPPLGDRVARMELAVWPLMALNLFISSVSKGRAGGGR